MGEDSGFAGRLRALREGRGWSIGELARRAGISRMAVSHLEAGHNDPSWLTVQALALALGVDHSALAEPGLTIPGPQPLGKPGRPRKNAPPKGPPPSLDD